VVTSHTINDCHAKKTSKACHIHFLVVPRALRLAQTDSTCLSVGKRMFWSSRPQPPLYTEAQIDAWTETEVLALDLTNVKQTAAWGLSRLTALRRRLDKLMLVNKEKQGKLKAQRDHVDDVLYQLGQVFPDAPFYTDPQRYGLL